MRWAHISSGSDGIYHFLIGVRFGCIAREISITQNPDYLHKFWSFISLWWPIKWGKSSSNTYTFLLNQQQSQYLTQCNFLLGRSYMRKFLVVGVTFERYTCMYLPSKKAHTHSTWMDTAIFSTHLLKWSSPFFSLENFIFSLWSMDGDSTANDLMFNYIILYSCQRLENQFVVPTKSACPCDETRKKKTREQFTLLFLLPFPLAFASAIESF